MVVVAGAAGVVVGAAGGVLTGVAGVAGGFGSVREPLSPHPCNIRAATISAGFMENFFGFMGKKSNTGLSAAWGFRFFLQKPVRSFETRTNKGFPGICEICNTAPKRGLTRIKKA